MVGLGWLGTSWDPGSGCQFGLNHRRPWVKAASLRDVNETLQEKFASLDKSHKDLEVQFDTLWNSTSQPNVVSNSSNPSTSNGCARCYNIDLNSYATNVDAMQALKKENERLGTLLKYGCMKTFHLKDALYKTITAHPNKDGHGLGFSGGSPVSKSVMVNGKECLMFVREEGKVVAYFNGNYNDEYRTCVWVPKALAYSSGGLSWVVDSGCTNHMTGERSMFTSLDEENGTRENIVFGDDGKGKALNWGISQDST
uniref:Transposon protein, putative, unclassified n=1 Tax=Oryza sativa subsp. japonica TaxID=39947 RepID=Q2QRH2_ORYSJ|nr:transposon protein, putative, unclassified [Oryza sativa Japonica Group]